MIIKELNDRHTLFIEPDLFTDGVTSIDLNLHLIMGEHRNYLIDTGLGSDHAKEINDYLVSKNNKELIIINSHCHWDHILGNDYFNETYIIGHTNIIDHINGGFEEVVSKFSDYFKGEVAKKLPNLLVSESLHFKDDDIYIFYTPGHSNDGLSTYDGVSNILNVGDNIGDTVDEPIPGLEDITLDEYKEVVLKYKNLAPEFIVSGHNKVQPLSFLDKVLNQIEIEQSKES